MKRRFWLVLALLIPFTAMAASNTSPASNTSTSKTTNTSSTKYVSDHLVITLRTGQGNQYQIIKTLASGTPLTVLQQTTTGYTQVQTTDGTQGWVRTQYLSDSPPAAVELAKAQDKLDSLQTKLSKIQQAYTTLRKQNAQLNNEYGKLKSNNKDTSDQLAKLSQIAAHPKQLESENIDLRQKYAKISDEYTLIKQENQVLKDRSQRNWFLAGALVVIIGMIIGLIIPKLRFRRKDGWDF